MDRHIRKHRPGMMWGLLIFTTQFCFDLFKSRWDRNLMVIGFACVLCFLCIRHRLYQAVERKTFGNHFTYVIVVSVADIQESRFCSVSYPSM